MSISPVDSNLYALFQAHFPADLSRPVLETEDGEIYSYRNLEGETARYAAFLSSLGIVKGDRVLVQVDKSPQALFLYLACVRGGFIYLPLNPAYQKSEMQYILADAEPRVVVSRPQSLSLWRELTRAQGTASGVLAIETLDADGGGSLVEKARNFPPRFGTVPCDKNDLAAILYTSGTTGKPKGAMITHLNLAANGQALHDFWRWTPSDVLLHAVPLFHVHGLFVACSCALLSGTKMIFLRTYNAAEVVKNLPRATVFMGVPTYYTRLLENPEFTRELCGNIRLFISGSAPLLEQTFLSVQERTGHALVDRYGLTETGANCSTRVDAPRVPGNQGVPLPGVAIRIAGDDDKEVPHGEIGEIQLRGDNVCIGYWKKPAETAAAFTSDGFFRTGDLGRCAPNGDISVVGRSKDLVISGGLNVYPKEIEAAIDQMDGVEESAVIGVNHPDFGEAVIAIVVPKHGRDDLTEAGMVASLKQLLANFKVPKRIFFAPQLPRNTMGKVQKNILRANAEYASVFSAAPR